MRVLNIFRRLSSNLGKSFFSEIAATMTTYFHGNVYSNSVLSRDCAGEGNQFVRTLLTDPLLVIFSQ